MLEINPALDDEWRFGDLKTTLVEKWKSATSQDDLFTPDVVPTVITNEAAMDPWQKYVWDTLLDVEQKGFLYWVWCGTNQSGKDEILKYMQQHLPGGLLILKNATTIPRLVNICKSRGNFRFLVVNLGMQDSKAVGEHCNFWEEIGNYGAAAASDMFGGRTHVYKHDKSLILANAPPPKGIQGRRVKVFEIPSATDNEMSDPSRTAYRARLRSWVGASFEPILEHLAHAGKQQDVASVPVVKSKRHGQEVVEQLHQEKTQAEARLLANDDAKAHAEIAAEHYKRRLTEALGHTPSPPPKKLPKCKDLREMFRSAPVEAKASPPEAPAPGAPAPDVPGVRFRHPFRFRALRRR